MKKSQPCLPHTTHSFTLAHRTAGEGGVEARGLALPWAGVFIWSVSLSLSVSSHCPLCSALLVWLVDIFMYDRQIFIFLSCQWRVGEDGCECCFWSVGIASKTSFWCLWEIVKDYAHVQLDVSESEQFCFFYVKSYQLTLQNEDVCIDVLNLLNRNLGRSFSIV